MPTDLPTVTRYLDALPRGVDSYPDCTVKASVVRNAIEAHPLGPEVPLVPALRALVDHPPPVSVWIPEVHLNAVSLAILDVHFSGTMLEAYRDAIYEQNCRLFGTALYRALFFVLSPERLFNGLQKRWGSFRRGTEARLVQRSQGAAEVRVDVPAHLTPEPSAQAMAQALRAGLDCAGAKRTRVEGAVLTPTEVAYRARWE